MSAPDDEVLQQILDGLPRGWSVSGKKGSEKGVKWRFALVGEEGAYRVRDGDGGDQACADLELAIGILRTKMRRFIGYHSPDLVSVHAGVVAHGDRAILLPGHSFAGTSTLVEALARAGAHFLSDEYAMLDREGRVARYSEPPSPRSAEDAARVGLVAFTVYKPGATWSPRRLTTGEAVVAMMGHSMPAQDRPTETLTTLRLALENAQVLASDRGEADETARLLLDALAGADR